MSELFTAYCELINSPTQLAQCRQAKSLPELLSVIKKILCRCDLTDDYLLSELGKLNQYIINEDSIRLGGHWLPYRYDAKSRSIYWCLFEGYATESFLDEYISRCRQSILLNQLIQPRTSLPSLLFHAKQIKVIKPAGFIFHVSRCGSTLVSGCLSELDSTCVFSESPVLTNILLDASLTLAQQQEYLQQLINLQASIFLDREKVIIKWNAWDVFRLDLICTLYPQVPILFLVRNPIEVLMSHQRSVGRHMSGDTSMADFHSVFSLNEKLSEENVDAINPIIGFQVNVLKYLFYEMLKQYSKNNLLLMDYSQLNVNNIFSIANNMNINVSSIDALKVQERFQFHSKIRGVKFSGDTVDFPYSINDHKKITDSLSAVYHKLLDYSNENLHVK